MGVILIFSRVMSDAVTLSGVEGRHHRLLTGISWNEPGFDSSQPDLSYKLI